MGAHKEWIDEAAAAEVAERALRAQEWPGGQPAQVSRDGHTGQPLLVERLDRTGVAYYLIPWSAARGVEALVRVDAATGALLSVAMLEEPTSSPLLRPEQALTRARAAYPNLDFGLPHGVWRPCRQSATPVRPLYEIPFEAGTVYVDMDGVVHGELTPLGLGG